MIQTTTQTILVSVLCIAVVSFVCFIALNPNEIFAFVAFAITALIGIGAMSVYIIEQIIENNS